MGWLSVKAIELDQAETAARSQALVEENTRLALWRMESIIAPLLARENARPHIAYSAFYSTESGLPSKASAGDPRPLASPLLRELPSYVRVHFEISRDGSAVSPQVPTGRWRDLALASVATSHQIEESAARLAQVQKLIDHDAMLAERVVEEALPANNFAQLEVPESPQPKNAGKVAVQQQARSQREFQARSQYATQNSMLQGAFGPALNELTLPMMTAQVGVMTPQFVADELILARKVIAGRQEYLQGCWIDWPALRKTLLDGVSDLLPHATLETLDPAASGQQEDRLLAALPVSLVPGPLGASSTVIPSAIRWSLALAWVCVALVAAAIGTMLSGVLSLSERRAAFVSAVTHELRTPLTTFRMYSEMLAEGMVPNEDQRSRYLNTLRLEADRLTHLVENVLAYARLERGGLGGRLQSIPGAELVEHASERLAGRAEQARATIEVHISADAAGSIVRADPSAVEQILFNLVDNACKYGSNKVDPRILVEASCNEQQIQIRVRDFGHGISDMEKRRLFQPFRKSARDAAHSAPGVGLGLALSRRLARDMGGDLQLEAQSTPGASFVLTLPLAG
jgi:signal transduction histidine kinase